MNKPAWDSFKARDVTTWKQWTDWLDRLTEEHLRPTRDEVDDLERLFHADYARRHECSDDAEMAAVATATGSHRDYGPITTILRRGNASPQFQSEIARLIEEKFFHPAKKKDKRDSAERYMETTCLWVPEEIVKHFGRQDDNVTRRRSYDVAAALIVTETLLQDPQDADAFYADEDGRAAGRYRTVRNSIKVWAGKRGKMRPELKKRLDEER